MTPEQDHLLASVDGAMGVDELAFITGMSPERVSAELDLLVRAGLVTFAPVPPPVVEVKKEEGDGIDLSPEMRERIDTLFALIGIADYYALLDVDRYATDGEIKKAYYKLAPKFHPDRHYGKRLGHYKSKIETIFTTLTKAHDTLRKAGRRSEYDLALPPRASRPGSPPPRASRPDSPPPRPSRPGATLPPTRPPMRSDVDWAVSPSTHPPRDSYAGAPPRARGPIATERPPAEARDRHAVPPRPPQPSVPPDAPSGAATLHPEPAEPAFQRLRRQSRTGGAGAVTRGADAAAVRAAVARKLGGGKVEKQRADEERERQRQRARGGITEVRRRKRSADEIGDVSVRRSDAEVLRDRFGDMREQAREKRLSQYLDRGREALAGGDYRTAVAAFEQALRIDPDDPYIKDKLAEAARKAAGQ